MKASLKPGLSFSKTILVDEGRCIGFMGKEGMVYATPMMVSDVEYTCRDFLLGHLDAGEDSVGAHVSIDHLAPTPLGLKVMVEIRVTHKGGEIRQAIFASMDKTVQNADPQMQQQVQEMAERFKTPEGFVALMLFTAAIVCVLFVFFSILGGAIGSSMTRRKPS